MDLPDHCWTDALMTILFGLLTAMSNALAVTMQHIASTRKREPLSSWGLVGHLFRQPLWLLGWVALTGSLVFQAVALHFGPLSLVQPLLVFELVIALLLRRYWIHQSIRGVTWLAALMTSAGLAIFLLAAAPSGARLVPTNSEWRGPVVASVGAAVIMVALAQRGSPGWRAGLFASATAVLWALEATFIKAASDTLTTFGVSGALVRWPVYALVIGGIAGLLCEQAALHVGPLKVSQLFIVIVDPLVSIGLGVWLYGERTRGGALHIGLATAALVVMCVGVVVLTRTAPATVTADVHRL